MTPAPLKPTIMILGFGGCRGSFLESAIMNFSGLNLNSSNSFSVANQWALPLTISSYSLSPFTSHPSFMKVTGQYSAKLPLEIFLCSSSRSAVVLTFSGLSTWRKKGSTSALIRMKVSASVPFAEISLTISSLMNYLAVSSCFVAIPASSSKS